MEGEGVWRGGGIGGGGGLEGVGIGGGGAWRGWGIGGGGGLEGWGGIGGGGQVEQRGTCRSLDVHTEDPDVQAVGAPSVCGCLCAV